MHANISTPIQDSPEQPSSNKCGVVGLILSITGVLLCGLWLLTIPGFIISIIGLRKEPKTAAITGVVLGGVGIIEFFLIGLLMPALMLPVLGRARQIAQVTITTSNIHHVQIASENYKVDNGSYPQSLDELTEGIYIDSDSINDAWDHQLNFEGGGKTRPIITSAGQDGEFGTADDIDEFSTAENISEN